MDKKVIKTDRASAPVGPYSQAVKAGNLIFCSGQIAIDPGTGILVDSNIDAETTRVMENLKAVLEAAGSSLNDVIKVTIFLRDMNDFKRVNEVYASYFQEPYPARAAVQAACLPKGAGIEIECIALTH